MFNCFVHDDTLGECVSKPGKLENCRNRIREFGLTQLVEHWTSQDSIPDLDRLRYNNYP